MDEHCIILVYSWISVLVLRAITDIHVCPLFCIQCYSCPCIKLGHCAKVVM